MTPEKTKAIEMIFDKVESLPTLPNLALDIVMIAENPQVSLSNIALLIQKDPSMSCKLLKIANSAFYGYSRKVNNLQSALLILGLREVKNIILSISIINMFNPAIEEIGFNRQLFWTHSAGCAQIARTLAFKMGFFDLELEAFTVGLIHDIGKIVIDQFCHNDFIKILKLIQEHKFTFLEAEKTVLGITHAQIGGWLAQKWLFPEEVSEAIEYHHHPTQCEQGSLLSSLVHVADIFCKAQNLSLIEEFKGEAITDNSGWKIIKEKSPRKNIPFDIERFTFGLDEEISRAQQFINISRGIGV